MRKQGKTRDISKKHNKKQEEQQKTMENKGKHIKISWGKQRKAQENKGKHRKTRKQEKTGKNKG